MATGTLVDVVMPQMGVSVSEGTITRWTKAVGEVIEADETIVEISTDKVDTEVPSPATGVVRELFAGEGETVPVNTKIAVIDTGGGDGSAEPPAAEGDGDGAVSVPGTGDGGTERGGEAAAAMPAGGDEGPVPGTRSGDGNGHNGHGGEGRTFVSPVVARMV